jgi:hypothetical protein
MWRTCQEAGSRGLSVAVQERLDVLVAEATNKFGVKAIWNG